MKINNYLFIAVATAITLASGFMDAKRDRRDIVASEADMRQDVFANQVGEPSKVNLHDKYYDKHHDKQHDKQCITQTIVVFAPCTTAISITTTTASPSPSLSPSPSPISESNTSGRALPNAPSRNKPDVAVTPKPDVVATPKPDVTAAS